uniref:Uncharacterized protein n=1 Tax=Arundo donax TaxID=35708 RepID=A0A0A9BVE7_ARUDO
MAFKPRPSLMIYWAANELFVILFLGLLQAQIDLFFFFLRKNTPTLFSLCSTGQKQTAPQLQYQQHKSQPAPELLRTKLCFCCLVQKKAKLFLNK